MNNRTALIIFAKAPEADAVKTRLRGHMSDSRRVELYTSLLEGTIGKLRDLAGADTFICYSPDGAGGYFARFGLRAFAQCEGDLGLRMHRALEEVLNLGYTWAALAGVDCPDISAEVVNASLELLKRCDIVFGPAMDGGYYLVALKEPASGIFEGMTWSTPEVLRQSLDRAEALGLKARLGPALYDIDTVKDVTKWMA